MLLERQRYAQARETLEPCREAMARAGRRSLEGAINAALLCCDAHDADWAAWDQHITRAHVLLRASGFVERDIAWVAEAAGVLAGARGARAQAFAAWRIALEQWTALGQAAGAERVRQRAAGVSESTQSKVEMRREACGGG